MKAGFGTNFHSIYRGEPRLYHAFSSAEFFSLALNRRLRETFTGNVLLDIACGTCNKTILFSRYFKKVYALDASYSLLSYGRELYGKNKKFEFLLASANHIPLLDNTVDTIVITWGSFPLSESLREIKRVLKPGGVALRIGVWGKDEFTSLFPAFDMKRVKRIQKQFESAGFRKEKHLTTISFKNLRDAKHILRKVVGAKEEDIKIKTLHHWVVLHYFRKPYGRL